MFTTFELIDLSSLLSVHFPNLVENESFSLTNFYNQASTGNDDVKLFEKGPQNGKNFSIFQFLFFLSV